ATRLISAPSLHDALPILCAGARTGADHRGRAPFLGRRGEKGRPHSAITGTAGWATPLNGSPSTGYTPVPIPYAWLTSSAGAATQDRKSTRLNSSHVKISY